MGKLLVVNCRFLFILWLLLRAKEEQKKKKIKSITQSTRWRVEKKEESNIKNKIKKEMVKNRLYLHFSSFLREFFYVPNHHNIRFDTHHQSIERRRRVFFFFIVFNFIYK